MSTACYFEKSLRGVYLASYHYDDFVVFLLIGAMHLSRLCNIVTLLFLGVLLLVTFRSCALRIYLGLLLRKM